MRARPITAQRRWQTIALYGISGVGKTTLAASAPRPYFCDSNSGLLSISDFPGLEHIRGDDVKVISDLDEVYDNFTGTGSHDWSTRFDTVVFDHFDDIQGIILDQLADKAAEKDSSREVDKLEQSEYGIMGNKLRRYLRKFKKLPKHKILICAEMTDYDSGRLKPHLIGGLKDDLPYYVDHTIYFRIGKKGVRYLHLDSTEDFYAKTRAHWLPPEARKIRVEKDDITALTKLFALIAAGPKGVKRSGTTKRGTR
jgi:GTPase SAR1 family protein